MRSTAGVVMVSALGFAAAQGSVPRSPPAQSAPSTPLNESPFIMTHDAASGYLGRGVVDAWTRTQEGGFAQQLSCGARALDARPKLDPELGLVWHHGDVTIPTPFNDSIAEIMAWCAENPDALVLLAVWDCDGEGCLSAATASLEELEIPMVSNCSNLQGMTLAEAEVAGELVGGGRLLALVGENDPNGVACSYGNYDPSITCSGFFDDDELAPPSSFPMSSTDSLSPASSADPPLVLMQSGFGAAVRQCLEANGVGDPHVSTSQLTQEQLRSLAACGEKLRDAVGSASLEAVENRSVYRCYQNDPLHSIPFTSMFAYLDEVASQGPPSGGQLVQMQALWQETAVTVVLGSLRLSSLVRDERRSNLNAALVSAVEDGRWGSSINLLEVNNVCHNGPALLRALQVQARRRWK